uniref:LAGLIDADG endonuclease n=1 Tax=Scytalidium sp. TaxID=1715249 RepID=A0A513U0U3_9PEZI|nr:LAGLIDADG endonuclease [Scytalidium sp.]
MLNILTSSLINRFDVPKPWGLYFQDSATPLPKWSGKSLMGIKLPNSGKPLELQVPSYIWKVISGWTNHSCKVISLKASEKNVGNRGSKSVICENLTVKEQRVDGSYIKDTNLMLRCTLTGFERNYRIKILTTQLINKRSYSTSHVSRNNNNHHLRIDPQFLTGFADAESSFVLSITKSNIVRSGWAIKPRFQIHLHKKDLFILEAIKNFLGVGKVYVQGTTSVEYRVFSIKELKVVLDHFDKFPLITQKYGDYILFKQAYLLWVDREHLTPEGLRKIISIKASMNNGLSEQLKEAFNTYGDGIIPAVRPIKENVHIDNPQWLAGFSSGEGSFGVKIRNSKDNSKAVVELIFQINQHVRDKQLITYIAEYLGCGNIYKHSVNAVVYRVSKRSDLTEIIIPFFEKYPILGIKALDFKDFCFISELIKNQVHHNKEGIDQILRIKSKMNSGRVEY